MPLIFFYTLKTSKNIWFSDVSRVYRKRPVARNGWKLLHVLRSYLNHTISFGKIYSKTKQSKRQEVKLNTANNQFIFLETCITNNITKSSPPKKKKNTKKKTPTLTDKGSNMVLFPHFRRRDLEILSSFLKGGS